MWPVFKSSIEGSELAAHGPIVKEDIRETASDLSIEGWARTGA